MERGLAMAAFGAMERESSPSPSSSGCQSGWTLYLDSDGHRCVPYCAPPAQRWMVPRAERTDDDAGGEDEADDSMASDASSGPRPSPREEDDDEARRDFELHHHGFFIDQHSYSSTSGHRGSASGSGCFGSSTRSRSSQGGARGGSVFQGAAMGTRQFRQLIVIDDDDELDDTASSSSAFFNSPMPMVHATLIFPQQMSRTSSE